MNRELKIKTSSCFIFFFEIASILGASSLENEKWMNYITTAFFVLAIFFVIISRLANRIMLIREFVILMFLLCFSLVGIKYSLARELIMFALTAWGISNEDADGVIKAYLTAKIIGSFFLVMLGFIASPSLQIVEGGVGRLGFANANGLGMELVDIILLLFAAFYDEQKKRKWIMFTLMAAAGIFYITESRTSTLGLIVLALLLLTTWWENARIVHKVLPTMFVILAIVSVWIACSYQEYSPIWMKLNEYSSGRFYSYHWYYTHMPITIMGNIFYAGKLWPLDNAYLYILFRYGVITLLIYALINWKMTEFYIENDNSVLLMCTVAYEVMAFMEFGPMSVTNNFAFAVYFASYHKEYVKRHGYNDSGNPLGDS